jgi:hypothetical protein
MVPHRRSRALIRTLLLAAITPLFVPASPSPSPPANLPEIGRVHSNTLCTALRVRIAPTVVGLMKNDEIISAGHRAFAKMGRDTADNSSGSIEIDKLYLEQVETRLVHNLKVVDMLLADAKLFPANATTDDERDATLMKAQLLAVADSQRKALDLVSGTLETESLGQMQHDINNQMASATGPNTGPLPAPTADPASFIGTAGLPDTSPQAGLPTRSSMLSTVGGHTVYDGLAAVLENEQGTIAQRERVATSSVIAAVNDCRAVASPVPSPAPSGP